MDSTSECVWVIVTVQIEITMKTIDQALVVRIIEPETAVRAALSVPEIHKVVTCGAQGATREVC
jgi:hypothetical protein